MISQNVGEEINVAVRGKSKRPLCCCKMSLNNSFISQNDYFYFCGVLLKFLYPGISRCSSTLQSCLDVCGCCKGTPLPKNLIVSSQLLPPFHYSLPDHIILIIQTVKPPRTRTQHFIAALIRAANISPVIVYKKEIKK